MANVGLEHRFCKEEPDEGRVLMTGATGFLGMEVLARYLERTDRGISLLMRGESRRSAEARLEQTLRSMFGRAHPYGSRVTAVQGDVTSPGLGLGADGDRLAEEVGEVVHGAASVSFEQDLRAARAINVQGTRRVLEFAERAQARGGLRRLSHISTAYVAGDHSGRFDEDDLDVGQSFRNAYERSKFEAESFVGRARARLPITILRPSIIVGERASGWTPSFNVLYWPLRAFARGTYRALPGRRDAPVDVVPVDYVADAVFALSEAPEAEGGTYHLTAGDEASSVGEIVDLATRHFDRPAPRLIDPSLYRRVVHPLLKRVIGEPRQRRALARSELFFPYFAMGAVFDDRRSRVTLGGAEIRPTPLRHYFDRLVDFAMRADWGRRPIPRARAVSGPLPLRHEEARPLQALPGARG